MATLERMTLPRRPSWSHLPPGATISDYDHAKFDRRFSLVGRPLLALTDGDDPLLAVAPAVIERAIRHNAAGAVMGVLQGQFWCSSEMRTFASRRGAAVGLEFNEEVARKVAELGLVAWASAKPSWCLNHRATDALKQLGDVDILAVSANKRVVWVIEAKDLKLCRTQGEAARRLSEYRGRAAADGKPDKMLRHLRRVEYLRLHSADLVQRLGLPAQPVVRGLVVVQAPQPMQFHGMDCGPDGRVLMLDELPAVPWDEPDRPIQSATTVFQLVV